MPREKGMALVLVIFLSLSLMTLAIVSVQAVKVHSLVQETQRGIFAVRQISESAAAHALVRIKEGGLMAPQSGGGSTAAWVNFSEGQYYYYTTYDNLTGMSVIRAWGRVAMDSSHSTCMVAPDASTWDGTGWILHGMEVAVRSRRYIPVSPLYFGNGGIEKPKGGFEWAAGVDPLDRSTWIPVTTPSSTQASSIPFQPSALDYPVDYLSAGGSPAPASSYPHPYPVWVAQNDIGQFDVEAWFANSAGTGFNPTLGVTPPPTSSYYDTSDRTSPDYPYPVCPDTPDVQSLSFELWNKYKSDASAPKLAGGSRSGTYGTLASPKVTFVTGSLQVSSGTTFDGCGILVIRDDYDPNTQTNNTPVTKAGLSIYGTFKWTGLVIVAGWAPDVYVDSIAGASVTIVGSLMGEDSVQSGGEVSLDSATISLTIKNTCRILYSNGLFRPGGLLYDFLPLVGKEVVGIRDL
jgi:hypothetical protein